MRILHAFCLNYNIGDYALGYGLKSNLRKFLDVELIGETNIQGREFSPYYINEVVNKRYDLLVLGGGGIIHGAHWPNGWFWLIQKELIKTIKIPFIVYGVGNNYWESEGGIPERTKYHLEETKQHAAYFSVRNDGSHGRLLNQTGIDANVIPDPGFHVNDYTDYEREEKNPYVVIQIAFDKPENRFGHADNVARFISDMKKVTLNLSRDYTVVFAPHVLDDLAISQEIAAGIKNAYVYPFKEYAFDKSYKALAYYKYADFVIAMRGHGQIVPVSFNTPVIALENHPKHRGLMQELDLLDYNVSVNQPDLYNELTGCINRLLANKEELKRKYESISVKLSEETAKGFVDIKGGLANWKSLQM